VGDTVVKWVWEGMRGEVGGGFEVSLTEARKVYKAWKRSEV
jgi:hypothetical protein